MVRAAGLEPARPYGRQIFVPTTTFAADAPEEIRRAVCSLDYPFIIAGRPALDAARLVSTPSPPAVKPAELGSGSAWVAYGPLAFPEFEQFYSRRFRRGTQTWFKSVVSTNSTTPAYSYGTRFPLPPIWPPGSRVSNQ